MGRAIVRDPQVFLFDEPLSNLDAKLRVQMRTEIKELHQRLQTTAIYVTHDQIEAMTMADRIVVMQHGLVEQLGAPLDLYDRPVNLFVAGFIGSPAMNFVDARVAAVRTGAGGRHRGRLETAAARRTLRSAKRPRSSTAFGPSTSPCASRVRRFPPRSWWSSRPVRETLLVTRVAGIECKAVFRERHRLDPGEVIGLDPQLDQVHVFDRASGRRLTH